MTKMSIVGTFVPEGRHNDGSEIREQVEKCLEQDRNRSSPTKGYLVVARGKRKQMDLCSAIFTGLLQGEFGPVEVTLIWQTDNIENALARFAMLKGYAVEVYLVILGVENLLPLAA